MTIALALLAGECSSRLGRDRVAERTEDISVAFEPDTQTMEKYYVHSSEQILFVTE